MGKVALACEDKFHGMVSHLSRRGKKCRCPTLSLARYRGNRTYPAAFLRRSPSFVAMSQCCGGGKRVPCVLLFILFVRTSLYSSASHVNEHRMKRTDVQCRACLTLRSSPRVYIHGTHDHSYNYVVYIVCSEL